MCGSHRAVHALPGRVAHVPLGTALPRRGPHEDLSSDEMNGQQAHRMGTLVLSLGMIAIGAALIVQVLGGDGSVLSARLLIGVLFLAAGLGRAFVEIRRGRGA